MTGAFREILARYGQAVELCRGGAEDTIKLKAFVQAVSDRSEEKIQPTPLGRDRRDRFLYLGDPDGDLDRLGETGYVLWRGERLRVRAAHPVYVGETVNHWWAVLEPLEEGEP